MIFLEQIVIQLPSAPLFAGKFVHLLGRLGQLNDGAFFFAPSDPAFYPRICLNFGGASSPQVDFILSGSGTITVLVENVTGCERRSPHVYTHMALDEVAGRLERAGQQVMRIDHAGCNLPWFDGGAHPQVQALRERLARSCLYHLFPSGEAWDFILPGSLEEIERLQAVDFARVRRPKFEIVSFEKASTPLLQFDVQLNASYEQLRELFPEALDDPDFRNLWLYLENPYGIDVCLVANEPDESDWSGYFADTRLRRDCNRET